MTHRETFVGDWETVNLKKFPNGLTPIVQQIHTAGFQAGLWLAPFVCEKKSALFHDHQDWLLRYRGKPWKNGPNWSGHYSLDIDNPEVVAPLDRLKTLIGADNGVLENILFKIRGRDLVGIMEKEQQIASRVG